MLIVHIVAGALALISGYTALYAKKGKTVHRKAGMLFVCSMLVMAFGGLTISIARNVAPAINVPAALITASLVITSLTTLRAPSTWTRWADRGAMATLLAVGSVDVVFALQAFANGGKRDGMPAFPFVMFGAVGLIAGIGDVRRMLSGPLAGARRIARHLWRMTFALFIAALSFFIGQAKVIPEPLRHPGLLALPVLAVLVTMFYWLWRVRRPRAGRAIPMAAVPQPEHP